MEWISNLFRFMAVVWCVLLWSVAHGDSTETAVQTYERVAVGVPSFPPAATSTTFTQPTTTTTSAVGIAHVRCGEWWGLAQEAGWHADSMPVLDYVMWRESRCLPNEHNTELNEDGSTDLGLTQINDWSWCLPTRWYPDGYLQTIGVLTTVGCKQLFDPATNLKAAKAIYDYSEEQTGNGWQPWGL